MLCPANNIQKIIHRAVWREIQPGALQILPNLLAVKQRREIHKKVLRDFAGDGVETRQ
jgi:hypothetical protein